MAYSSKFSLTPTGRAKLLRWAAVNLKGSGNTSKKLAHRMSTHGFRLGHSSIENLLAGKEVADRTASNGYSVGDAIADLADLVGLTAHDINGDIRELASFSELAVAPVHHCSNLYSLDALSEYGRYYIPDGSPAFLATYERKQRDSYLNVLRGWLGNIEDKYISTPGANCVLAHAFLSFADQSLLSSSAVDRRFRQADHAIVRACQYAARSHDPNLLGLCWSVGSMIKYARGEWDVGLQWARVAEESLPASCSDPITTLLRSGATCNQARCLIELGSMEDALKRLRFSTNLAEKCGSARRFTNGLAQQAIVLSRMGDAERSEATLDSAVTQLKDVSPKIAAFLSVEFRRYKVGILKRSGDYVRASKLRGDVIRDAQAAGFDDQVQRAKDICVWR